MSEVSAAYSVLGLGAPIVDLVVSVSDAFLAELPGELGGSEPIDHSTLKALVTKSGGQPKMIPGGSTSNLLRGLAGFGTSCVQLGMIGKDAVGQEFIKAMRAAGVTPLLKESDEHTSQVLCLVAPSGQRTMRFCLGASRLLKPEHLTAEQFVGHQHLHVEGYSFYAPGTAEKAMELAQNEGLSISLDLSSFEVVRAFLPQFMHVLEEYVDVVFANEKETEALLGVSGEKGCDALAALCEVGIVMMGAKGAWIRRGVQKMHIPAVPVFKPVDTTGAGDLFGAGFLHGYLDHYPLQQCGELGSHAAAAVIRDWGAVIPATEWDRLRALA